MSKGRGSYVASVRGHYRVNRLLGCSPWRALVDAFKVARR